MEERFDPIGERRAAKLLEGASPILDDSVQCGMNLVSTLSRSNISCIRRKHIIIDFNHVSIPTGPTITCIVSRRARRRVMGFGLERTIAASNAAAHRSSVDV